MSETEPGGRLALKEAQLHTAPDVLRGPVAGGDVRKARRGCGGREAAGQHGAQHQTAQQPFELLFHYLFSPLGTFWCQIIPTIPEFSVSVKPKLSKRRTKRRGGPAAISRFYKIILYLTALFCYNKLVILDSFFNLPERRELP